MEETYFQYRYTYFYCTLFYWASQIVHHFSNLKVCGNQASNKCIGVVFPTAFAHSAFLYHILLIPTIFQAFKLLLYLSWWYIISLWPYNWNLVKLQIPSESLVLKYFLMKFCIFFKYKIHHATRTDNIFFSITHIAFSNVDHISGPQSKTIETDIMQSMFHIIK